MKLCSIWILLSLACGRKENKPILVNVSLSVSGIVLPAEIEQLSLGSVRLVYGLEWGPNQKGETSYGTTDLVGGELLDTHFFGDGSFTSEGLAQVKSQAIWEDNSSCKCDHFRPNGTITITQASIELCKPDLLSKEAENFEGDDSRVLCISKALADITPFQIHDGASLSSDISLDFTESFEQSTSDKSGLCFEKDSESLCFDAFEAKVVPVLQ